MIVPIPAWLVMLLLSMLISAPMMAGECSGPMAALVRLAAERIDGTLGDVAASTRALGEAYREIAGSAHPVTADERERWLARATTRGSTTGFRTWPDVLDSPPDFQAPFAGLYSYNADSVGDGNVQHLAMLEALAPMLRAAYRSFDFSWVYLTIADNIMLIYPYLPMDQAVHNAPPTAQVYYKAADVEHRKVGWTLPYLDLVGAGMMITVSYPIIADNKLLGVASRDITLEQLSQSVLKHLAREGGASALIVDQRGLVIAASDDDLGSELQRVNTKAGGAVLFYRTPQGLERLQQKNAVVSRFDWANSVTEQVIDRGAKTGETDIVAFEAGGRDVLVARIPSTGWYVILAVVKLAADS